MATSLALVQRYQGVHKESAGYKLLSSMGWKEGEGLGALGQGIKEHIRVKKNYENWGVGAIESAERSRDWSAGMLEFHRVLSNLSEVTSVHASRADSDSDDDSKGTEKKEPVAKAVTHRGRFKRRESAKDVKKYGGEDLAAILGGGQDPFAALASAAQTLEEEKRAQSTETVSTSKSSKKKKEKSSKKEKPIKEQQQALPRIDAEAWWGDYFERSGKMGSAPTRKKKDGGITVHSFHEDDQEALYNRVQTGATQGHQGLGRSALPKKVAGTRWQGTKVRLDSDSDDESGQESAASASSSSEEEEEAGRIVIVMPTQARGPETAIEATTTMQHESSSDDAAKETIKWKKLVFRALRESEKKSLRHSKLVRAVAEAAGVPKKERMTVHAAVETVINGSKRLRLERDRVHLA